MSVDNRKYSRAKVKWPVVMMARDGLVDGRTQNLSLGGAFIRCSKKPDLSGNFRVVIAIKERLILVNAEAVWSDARGFHDESTFRGIGVCFTNIFNDDRRFLNGMISKHL